uniref:Uncharacterized protein TCIL3000_8_7850 n=1 Tax=Trypanosoma congolense (strain IL3000) TaxID=1068625 RepID=G0UT42_TRYCI|nr:unnamed protein product [Trypanosoma congolense IL3000]
MGRKRRNERDRLIPTDESPPVSYDTVPQPPATTEAVGITTPCRAESDLGPEQAPASPTEKRRHRETRVLFAALIFCFVFMVVELVFGVLANSLALLTDASHLLTDVGAYALSIVSLRAASRTSCGKYNYGWHRAEVIGTLVSVFSIWALVAWIVLEGLTRTWNVVRCSRAHAGNEWANLKLRSNESGGGHYGASGTTRLANAGVEEAVGMEMCRSIDSSVMVVVGVLGMVVNVVCASILYFGGSHGHSHVGGVSHHHSHGHGDGSEEGEAGHGHSHEHDHGCSDGDSDSHSAEGQKKSRGFAVHAALLHALGDCVQSVGVIIAGVFIYIANRSSYGVPSYRYSIYNLADPLCSLMFAAITLNMTRPLLRDLLDILMESTPPGIDYEELYNALKRIKGVEGVHDLHVWSISSDYAAMSVHLEADNKDAALQEAQQLCKRFGIGHTTIQVDTVENGAGLCHSACTSAQNVA